MRTLEEINMEIDNVKSELNNVHGSEAEVYTRIVGYYRSVRNWNKGKREEYDHRKMFDSQNSKTQSLADIHNRCCNIENVSILVHDVSKIDFYTRTTCPNCPPVAEFLENIGVAVTQYNVDSNDGFENARKNKVKSAPTVICYDDKGVETGRFYSVQELENTFNCVKEPVAVNA